MSFFNTLLIFYNSVQSPQAGKSPHIGMRHGAVHRHRKKTAEVRLYMLARGCLPTP